MARTLPLRKRAVRPHASDNDMRPEGLTALAEALRSNTGLGLLDLSGNVLCDLWQRRDGRREGVHTIDGIVALADALCDNQALQSIDLRHNELRTEGANAIGKSLAANDALAVLGLRLNSIDDDGAAALAKPLAVNTTLSMLDLRENGEFGPRALQAIDRLFAMRKASGFPPLLVKHDGNQPTSRTRSSSRRTWRGPARGALKG